MESFEDVMERLRGLGKELGDDLEPFGLVMPSDPIWVLGKE